MEEDCGHGRRGSVDCVREAQMGDEEEEEEVEEQYWRWKCNIKMIDEFEDLYDHSTIVTTTVTRQTYQVLLQC